MLSFVIPKLIILIFEGKVNKNVIETLRFQKYNYPCDIFTLQLINTQDGDHHIY